MTARKRITNSMKAKLQHYKKKKNDCPMSINVRLVDDIKFVNYVQTLLIFGFSLRR